MRKYLAVFIFAALFLMIPSLYAAPGLKRKLIPLWQAFRQKPVPKAART